MRGHDFSEGQKEFYRETILNNLTSASILLSFRIRDSGIELNAIAQKVRVVVVQSPFLIF